MRFWIGLLLTFAVLVVAVARPAIAADESEVLVLTALPATYSIASALARETRIYVVNVPADGRPMNALGRYFEKPGKDVLALFAQADAVVSIGKLWHDDPLYRAARAQNIRVVDIDATEPYSTTMPGIALVRQPSGGTPPWQDSGGSAQDTSGAGASPYFWLGLSNGVRAAEIVAHDFLSLAPRDGERIARNLAAYRRKLLDLKRTHEAKLATRDDVTVFALSADFAYLTNDLGIRVDGYFLRQDIEWTPTDIDAFRKHLAAHDIRAVIHKWEPSPAIQAAVEDAGATLVILRTSETFAADGAAAREESFVADLEANLKALDSAFSR